MAYVKPDIIVTVDPGGTSGIATFYPQQSVVYVGRQEKPMQAIDFVGGLMLTPNATVLAILERYTITVHTAKLTQQTDALEIIGAIKYLAYRTNNTVELQSPPTAKKIAPDAKLKHLGLHVPGRDHANDAARHLVLGIERHLTSLLDGEFLVGYSGARTLIERI